MEVEVSADLQSLGQADERSAADEVEPPVDLEPLRKAGE